MSPALPPEFAGFSFFRLKLVLFLGFILADRHPVDQSLLNAFLPGGFFSGACLALGVDLVPFLLSKKPPIERIALSEELVKWKEGEIARAPCPDGLEGRRAAGKRAVDI